MYCILYAWALNGICCPIAYTYVLKLVFYFLTRLTSDSIRQYFEYKMKSVCSALKKVLFISRRFCNVYFKEITKKKYPVHNNLYSSHYAILSYPSTQNRSHKLIH